MLRKLLPAVTLACLPAVSLAATPPCAAGPYREFDFWVGEWDVRDAEGKVAGVNRIASEENGCVLVERWNSNAAFIAGAIAAICAGTLAAAWLRAD